MLLAYHLILSCYGFWLPNDPRGSWSDYVRQSNLSAHGPATKVNTPQSLANQDHDHQKRLRTKQALTYPPAKLTGEQARSVAKGFTFRASRSKIRIHACAIMPDHVHLVIANDRRPIEMISNQLKGTATRQLRSDGLHPLAQYKDKAGKTPSIWAAGQWKVFITNEEQLHNTIRYVEMNPIKAGLKPQQWTFVKPPQ